MLREMAHFIRQSPKVTRMLKEHTRGEFMDLLHEKADAQGYARVRCELVEGLSGRVLEIGCGTGTMFRYFGEGVSVDAIEPDAELVARAIAKAEKYSGKIHAAAGDAMALSFADGTFDAVVIYTVLCSVPSVERVLSEAFRVLRPGGRFRALEHVRSEAPVAGFLMDLANPLWMRLNQGCNWNRNPMAAMESVGFRIDEVRAFQRFDTILPAFPMLWVKAHRPD